MSNIKNKLIKTFYYMRNHNKSIIFSRNIKDNIK